MSRATPIDPADHQDAAFGGCDEVPGCAAAASTSPPGSSTTGPSATAAPTSTAAPSSSMPAAAAPQLARVHLPGDDNEFSPFDLRQPAAGAVDWPVTFVFRGNATVEAVKDGLCNRTAHAWRYCDSGGAMYLYATAAGPQSPFRGFLSSGGIKRFAEDCSSNEFTAHMRIYAPPAPEGAPSDGAGFTSATYGRFVVATVHLDFQDRSGCSGRIHGYADVAEQWFIAAMTSIPGWHVHPDQIDLGNANDAFVVLRDVGGVDVPHVYVNEQFATEVVID